MFTATLENFVLPCMLYVVYMCCTFIISRVHGGFYGLDLKMEMVVLMMNSSMKKTAADSKAKGKKLGSTNGLLG